MSYKITFEPTGITTTMKEDETILEAAQSAGVFIEAYCGSQKVCGKCRIKTATGTVSPITESERKLLTEKEILNHYRLACMTTVASDVVIEIPNESSTRDEVILKEGKEIEFEFKPSVKTYPIKLKKAALDDNRDDVTRLKDELHQHYTDLCEELEIEFSVLKQLSKMLRESNWEITVTILYHKKIIKVEKGSGSTIYGIAIDVGTTTIAAYLCDQTDGRLKQKTSMMNPQIRFGDDVLTRISYCVNNEDGLELLQTLLMDGLNDLVNEMAEKEGIQPDQIAEAVIVCNTVMQHIALGIRPDFIGVSPFVSTLSEAIDITARKFGLHILPGGNIHFLPSEAGFIGADNVAVLIAEEPYRQDKLKLIIDIGTNSEICLGNKEKLYVTSCATGPALEGAQIKCGMRAASGAIEAVTINPVTLEPTLKIIGSNRTQAPIGICGSGIIDAVSQMASTGILDPDGKFSKIAQTDRIRLSLEGKPEYVLYDKKREEERDIVVTQKDVRAVQLAKAALYAGAKALMKRCGIEQVDEIVLAGAFGSYIDKKNALKLGLYPDCHLDQVSVIGNAAGFGARLALCNSDKRNEAKEIARAVEFIETATNPDYQTMFAWAMSIPHEKDLFTANEPTNWACGGKDDRSMSREVLDMVPEAFENVKLMEKAILCNQAVTHTDYLTFPLMQGIEAMAYGAKPGIVGTNMVISEYTYQTLESIDDQLSIMDHPVIQNTLTCMEKHSDEKMVLEVVGPFSILAALINPIKLYSYRRKNKELLVKVLSQIADSLADYTIQAIKRGVKIISFADPSGVGEIVGDGFYRELSGAATYHYFKKIEPYLKHALVHLCGKSSVSMHRAGYMTVKRYRTRQEETYINLLFEASQNKKIKFVGHNCIHTIKLQVPLLYKLELV